MLDRIKKEPSLVTGLVLAVIGVASAFGLDVTDGQSAGIVALVGAVLALLGAGVTRSKVTPAALVAVKDDEGVFRVARDPETGQFVSTKHATIEAAKTGSDLGAVLGKPEPDGKDTR